MTEGQEPCANCANYVSPATAALQGSHLTTRACQAARSPVTTGIPQVKVDESAWPNPGALLSRRRLALLFIVLLTLASGSLRAQPAAPGVPTTAPYAIIELEGTVEVSRAGSPLWDPARVDQPLLPGDRVRTGDRSRAVVRLSDRTLIRKGPRTLIEIPAAKGA